MQYKLYANSLNDPNNAKKTVLLNRGIEDIDGYLKMNDSCLLDYSLLDNIDRAVECLLMHLENESNIHIVVDSDCDGYTSAAMMYSYIKLLEPNAKLSYSLHTGKEHGLSDDVVMPDDVHLIIVPDAGTNDWVEHKNYNLQGIDIIILDHHQQEFYDCSNETEKTVIINNQTSKQYTNKNLCGAGIVYKFLQAIDSETWSDYADKFLDLVALGNIADSMDVRSFETKRLIDKGLKNIKNKLFSAMIEKQSYSIGNKLNIIGVQWYIAPLVNGMIRAGTQEEKELMFKAFIEQDEFFEYKTRASKNKESEIIQESIYDRVARLCANARQKQNKSKDVGIDSLCEYINAKGLNNNKILFVPVDSMLNKNLTGVAAIKIAERYGKPCILLRQLENQILETKIDEDGKTYFEIDDKDIVFGGSGRNLDNSPIESLKDFLIETGCFEYVQGHDGAFGFEIKKSNIPKAIQIVNKKLKDVEFDNKKYVDLILDIDQINIGTITDIAELKPCYGQKFKPAKIVMKNLCISKSDCNIIGKSSDTVKFNYNDEMEFIKFKCGSEDPLVVWLNNSDWNDESDEEIVIDIMGECDINEFGSKKTPQIKIDEYEIVNGSR